MLINARSVASARMFVALAACLVLTATVDASTIERSYLFGDDGSEVAVVGNSPSSTFDSTDISFLISNDLNTIGPTGGGPKYADATITGGISRPGSTPGTKYMQFDGVDDRVYMPGGSIPGGTNPVLGSLGVPSVGDNRYGTTPAGDPNFTSNGGIQTHFIDGYVYPTSGQLGTGTTITTQDIVSDSNSFRIRINNNGASNAIWRMTAGGNTTDAAASGLGLVTFNAWTHVMLRTVGTGSAALYVNGVVVAASGGTGTPGAGNLVFGANASDTAACPVPTCNPAITADPPANFFMGVIDDFKFGVAGNNTPALPASPSGLNGQNWGNFDLAVDNDFVRRALIGKSRGDVDLDGDVDSVDQTTLVTNWLRVQNINNQRFGDMTSHAFGDLDFDGDVDLADAFLLRQGLHGFGSGGAIPEPGCIMLAMIGLVSLASLRRRGA